MPAMFAANAHPPLARAGARHPHRVGDRSHQDVGVPELRLEQDPETVEQREEPEASPDPAEIFRLVGASRESLEIGPVRNDRCREVDVQVHAEEAEQAGDRA